MKLLSAFAIGMIFGLGIAIAGMANPAKVLNFFDVFGTFDPSLAFVMGGALITTAIGYRLVVGTRPKPVYGEKFAIPTKRDLDMKLIGGSTVFGIGWGITGFCPGGAIPALGLGHIDTLVFMVSMTAGIMIATYAQTRAARLRTA